MLKPTLTATAAVFALSALSPVAMAVKGDPHVLSTTSAGNIELELDKQKTPMSVQNFIDYMGSGSYNSTILRRIIPGSMIRGGGFTGQMQQGKPNPSIKNKADSGLHNTHDTIMTAHTVDKDSVANQSFINTTGSVFLGHDRHDFDYAVFGKVAKGMDVVGKISQVSTHDVGSYQNVPSKLVVTLSAEVLP